MFYILKVGALYVTSDGSLSDSQNDALRVDLSDARDKDDRPRPVKLTPKRF